MEKRWWRRGAGGSGGVPEVRRGEDTAREIPLLLPMLSMLPGIKRLLGGLLVEFILATGHMVYIMRLESRLISYIQKNPFWDLSVVNHECSKRCSVSLDESLEKEMLIYSL